MNQKIDTLKKDIVHELGQIDKVLECILDLNRMTAGGDPDINTKTAMAGYLMNFYNGIENIFKRVAKDYYEVITGGEA